MTKSQLMIQKATVVAAKKSSVDGSDHCKVFAVQDINPADAQYTEWAGAELATINCSPQAFSKLSMLKMPATVELHGRMKTSSKSTQFYVEDATLAEQLVYQPLPNKKSA